MKLFQSYVFFFFGACLSAGSRAQSSQGYIVGGQTVSPKDPITSSTVGLFAPSADGHSGSLCTASLIKNDIAVTAAHCIEPGAGKPVVLFGPNLHSQSTIRRPVQGVVINSKWQRRAGRGMDQGDIALIKFPGGLPAGFQRVPTVESDADIKSGTDAILAGYGISNARTKSGAGRLRKTRVQVLNNRPGQSEMILDQSRGHGACHGDSGGPAYIRKNGKIILAGVTNRGFPDSAPDDCGHQVIYTKLPAYRSWIAKNEKKLEASPVVARPLGVGKSSITLLRHRIHHTHNVLRSTRHVPRISAKGRHVRIK